MADLHDAEARTRAMARGYRAMGDNLRADALDRVLAELDRLRQPIPADHECDFPPGITDSEQRYYQCPDCGAHWVKVKRMVGRQMYRSWHRMSDAMVARMEAERRNVRGGAW